MTLFQDISPADSKYTNPVIKEDAPDPSVIRADNGYYYLYSTGEKIYKSLDLVNWQYVRQVFEGMPRPSFLDVNGYWAPCITKQGKIYVLYFALSVWDGIDTAGIGVATSDSPEGPFKIVGSDGKLFRSWCKKFNRSIFYSRRRFKIYNMGKLLWYIWHRVN